MFTTILTITAVSLLWFVVGYAAASWATYCGKTGANPMPSIPNPFKRQESNGEPQEKPSRPRVGV